MGKSSRKELTGSLLIRKLLTPNCEEKKNKLRELHEKGSSQRFSMAANFESEYLSNEISARIRNVIEKLN